jgi:hypothetical protein
MLNYQNNIKALKHSIYYKTECLDCELIISIKWECEYTGLFKTRQHKPEKRSCPFCNGTHTISARIKYKNYLEINKHWDIFDLMEAE